MLKEIRRALSDCVLKWTSPQDYSDALSFRRTCEAHARSGRQIGAISSNNPRHFLNRRLIELIPEARWVFYGQRVPK